jgi:hypothetical protein
MKKLFVIIAAAALVFAFVAPAPAVDWNFFGSARMATFYFSDDYGDQDATAATGIYSQYFGNLNSNSSDQDGMQWEMQSNSRLGARVKAESVSGYVEMGLKGSEGNDIDVGTRRIYGQWDFGAGKFKIGKDYTPCNQFISSQTVFADTGLLGIGTYYAFRPAQASLSFGGFTIAAITNDADSLSAIDGTAANGDVQYYLPKLEAGWGMGFDNFSFGLMGGFQTYTEEDVVSLRNGRRNDVDVTSWVLGAQASFNIGPAYIRGSVSYDENGGNAGWLSTSAYWDGDDDVKDSNVTQAALVAGFKMSDMLSFEGGFGYSNLDSDEAAWDDFSPWSAYVNATVGLAPGVYIIPEIGYFDYDDNPISGDDQGNTFYAGAKWQIDF